MGRRWISPSLFSVAKFVMSVIERILSISVELRIGGLSEAGIRGAACHIFLLFH
jgi:hypothetical protein